MAVARGDVRLGGVRREVETRERERERESKTRETTSERDVEDGWKKKGEGERERYRRAKRRAGANLACQEVAYSSRTKASRGTRARLEAALGTHRSVWMVEDDEKDG